MAEWCNVVWPTLFISSRILFACAQWQMRLERKKWEKKKRKAGIALVLQQKIIDEIN